jgi:hypothetical protein
MESTEISVSSRWSEWNSTCSTWSIWIPPGFLLDSMWKWTIIWLGSLQRNSTWIPGGIHISMWIPCGITWNLWGRVKSSKQGSRCVRCVSSPGKFFFFVLFFVFSLLMIFLLIELIYCHHHTRRLPLPKHRPKRPQPPLPPPHKLTRGKLSFGPLVSIIYIHCLFFLFLF